MRKIVILLGIALLTIVFFSSCSEYKYDVSDSLVMSLQNDSAVSSTAENSRDSSDDYFEASEILGLTGQIYAIDEMYIDEMNENSHASSAAKGDITHKYTEQWHSKMDYYYTILYEALDTAGKEALKLSQESWQTAFDAELELNACIQSQNMILYDVFDNPKYMAYRNRTIALYLKCRSMNNLGEHTNNTYVLLE